MADTGLRRGVWLERVPDLVEACVEEWRLRLGDPYVAGAAGHAVRADLPDGTPAVLKLIFPHREGEHEAAALVLLDGDGAVRLLEHDAKRWAMLIERCVPGDDASSIDDDEAIRVAVATGRELWRAVAGRPFRRAADEVARWFRELEAKTDHPYLGIAAALYASMTPRHDVLVHGDYHHHNLLRHGDRWLAIDPKPLIAEPEFDVVTLLWNPLQRALTRELTERRIRQLASAGLDERRMRDWAIVRGAQLGLPLHPGEDEAASRQLSVVRWLLE